MVETQITSSTSAAQSVPRTNVAETQPQPGVSFAQEAAVVNNNSGSSPSVQRVDSPASIQKVASTGAAAQSAPAGQAVQPNNGSSLGLSGQEEAISKAERAVNEALAKVLSANERVSIGFDAAAESFVYQKVDKESGEVKGQFPAEEVLRSLAFWRSRETGIPPSTSGVVVDGKI